MMGKAYESYSDSHTPWIGLLPSHWTIKKIKHIATLRSGEAITADQIQESGEYPVFGGNGMRGYTSNHTHEGDHVLIGRQGALCGNVNYASGKFWASEHAVVASGDYEPVWFGELLKIMNLNQYSATAAQPGLSVDVIGNLPLPVPPKEERVAISGAITAFSKQIDTLIAEQQALIGWLREKRKAVTNLLVTKGLNPQAPMKACQIDGIGSIPAHWEVRKLKLIAEVRGGVAKGKDLSGLATVRVPYLRVANVQDGYLDLTEVEEIEIPARELERYLLQPGDVLMNEGGDFDKLGRGHVWREEVSPCIHQNHVFSVRPHGVRSEWLNAVSGSAYAQFFFMGRAKQSTNLASISASNLSELPVVLPPEPEQVQILAALGRETTKIDTLITEAEISIALLQEHCSALIMAVVTGKVDVRDIMKEPA